MIKLSYPDPWLRELVAEQCEKVAHSAPGWRRYQLFRAAVILGHHAHKGELSRAVVEGWLEHAAGSSGLILCHGVELVEKTIRAGLDHGAIETQWGFL